MRSVTLGSGLLALACAARTAPMAALPPRPEAVVSAPPAPAPLISPASPADGASPASSGAAPSAPPPLAPASVLPPLVTPAAESAPLASVRLEPVYSALGHAKLATDMLSLERDEELFQWALGGSADPAHPGNRPGYHPATRVVVDVELLSRAPKGSTKRLLRIARSSGYWRFRACFEAAQRITPKSERSTKVRLTLSATGRVLGSRSVGLVPERDYARCVLAKARSLDFTPGFTRKLDLEIAVNQWPGHAPVPPRAPEGTPAPKLSETSLEALQALSPSWSACYQKGLVVDPRLWGRLAFKLTLSPDGAPQQAIEVETRFPNAEVVECARQALLGARLGESSATELTLAIRFGQPPPPSPPIPEGEVGPAPPAPPALSPPAPPAPPPPVSVH